jgi:hypothetical protein
MAGVDADEMNIPITMTIGRLRIIVHNPRDYDRNLRVDSTPAVS